MMIEIILAPVIMTIVMIFIIVCICWCQKAKRQRMMERQYHNYPSGTRPPGAVHTPQVQTAYPVPNNVVGFDPANRPVTNTTASALPPTSYGSWGQSYPPPTAPPVNPAFQTTTSDLPPSYDSVVKH